MTVSYYWLTYDPLFTTVDYEEGGVCDHCVFETETKRGDFDHDEPFLKVRSNRRDLEKQETKGTNVLDRLTCVKDVSWLNTYNFKCYLVKPTRDKDFFTSVN